MLILPPLYSPNHCSDHFRHSSMSEFYQGQWGPCLGDIHHCLFPPPPLWLPGLCLDPCSPWAILHTQPQGCFWHTSEISLCVRYSMAPSYLRKKKPKLDHPSLCDLVSSLLIPIDLEHTLHTLVLLFPLLKCFSLNRPSSLCLYASVTSLRPALATL